MDRFLFLKNGIEGGDLSPTASSEKRQGVSSPEDGSLLGIMAGICHIDQINSI